MESSAENQKGFRQALSHHSLIIGLPVSLDVHIMTQLPVLHGASISNLFL